MDKPFFTALTCTYNRAHLLHRPYESLKNQTCRNFEWIVFDNGSSDNTRELVEKWKEEADFPIRLYSRPDNAGIQNAYRFGVNHAEGDFWFIMDSDDELVPEALVRMKTTWDEIPADKQSEFAGITSNCIDQHGNLVGNEFPSSPLDSTIMETAYKFGVTGEKFGVIRVAVLKEFPFQDVLEHVQPGAIWGMINKKYKTRYINESLRIYFIDEPNRFDQLSRNESMLQLNAYGGRLNCQYSLNNELRWFQYAPFLFVKTAVHYRRYSGLLNIELGSQLRQLNSIWAKLIYVLAVPVDIIHRCYTKARLGTLFNSRQSLS